MKILWKDTVSGGSLKSGEIAGDMAKGRILKRVFQKKQSTPNFPENEHFLSPDTHLYVCVSEGEKCSFFGKFSVLCFF